MTIDQTINLLVTITLIEMMVAIGLGVPVAELVAVARDWRLVARAVLANYVVVPAATVGLHKEDPTIAELLKPLGYAKDYPPRQKAASFNLDDVMKKLSEGGGSK